MTVLKQAIGTGIWPIRVEVTQWNEPINSLVGSPMVYVVSRSPEVKVGIGDIEILLDVEIDTNFPRDIERMVVALEQVVDNGAHPDDVLWQLAQLAMRKMLLTPKEVEDACREWVPNRNQEKPKERTRYEL